MSLLARCVTCSYLAILVRLTKFSSLNDIMHAGITTTVIIFCGHRLHVHPRFSLYLTTTTHPSSLPPSLLSDLNVINLGPSVPLAQDLLLDEAFLVLLPEESSSFRAVCHDIAKHKERLKQLEGEVFDSLPKEGRTESYAYSTDRITAVVELINEVGMTVQPLPTLCRGASWVHYR